MIDRLAEFMEGDPMSNAWIEARAENFPSRVMYGIKTACQGRGAWAMEQANAIQL